MSLVEIRDVEQMFGTFRAVKGVSFSFDAGTVYGFIGPNGSGKTTTMRVLATLDVATKGDAFIDGISVHDYPDRVRRRIGFLPDYYGTYPNTSVYDYLDFFGRAYGLRGADLKRRIESVVSFTGLGYMVEKNTDGLSKGMKQRMALGRILLHDPDLLILDEPAAGLDPRARIEFRHLIRLLADQGKAILITSHILTELSNLVDACAIIEAGRIVREGRVSDLRRQLRDDAEKRGTAAKLKIELAREIDGAEARLVEQPFVVQVGGGGREFEVEFSGTLDQAADFLAALVRGGLPVVGFRSDEGNLEDVFMSMTRGELQ